MSVAPGGQLWLQLLRRPPPPSSFLASSTMTATPFDGQVDRIQGTSSVAIPPKLTEKGECKEVLAIVVRLLAETKERATLRQLALFFHYGWVRRTVPSSASENLSGTCGGRVTSAA
jgi:hypothetical protein